MNRVCGIPRLPGEGAACRPAPSSRGRRQGGTTARLPVAVPQRRYRDELAVRPRTMPTKAST
ncbi:MAG: hypothetical protein J0J11_01390, partial [Microbacterium sp.]|nr:hypothetical protein [Microbacterium sp.]